jgi:hypothetical protein
MAPRLQGRLACERGTLNMKRMTREIVLLGLVVVAASCSSAVPTETPGVEQLGQYLMRQNGSEADVVLGYKHAAQSLGDEWLLVELAITSPSGESAKFERENIWVRTPAGVQVPVASQKAFGEAYGAMRNKIAQANVARDPMDYFPPNRQPCGLDLFVAPGEGVAFDQVTVNDRRACQGKLFFYIPGGVQPGRYVLGIDLQEDEIRIPFTLEAPR